MSQQFTYGVVSEGFLVEILRKMCGNVHKCGLLRQERVRNFHRNFAEILEKIFCNEPFPNDPISELLASRS